MSQIMATFSDSNMKATITFDLPDERQEHDMAIHGADYHAAIWELDQFLRDALKYGHQYKTADDALEAVRNRLHEELEGVPWEF